MVSTKKSLDKKINVKLKSFSKINLGLWIKEKRPDNFHEIETVYFENDNLYDELKVDFTEDNELQINVTFLQDKLNNLVPKEKNLVYKAALLFFKKLSVKGSCNITINKNIPLQAGLGGGSSNAACILKALNQLFDYELHESELLILANQIGSDVPFFIIGKTCLGKGRGELLTHIENKLDLEIKIVKPKDISVSTKWAYEQIDSREFISDHRREIDNIILATKKKDPKLLFENTFNDFEMVVFSYYPQLIQERKKLLEEGYKAVHLCGSGSALFGIREKRT